MSEVMLSIFWDMMVTLAVPMEFNNVISVDALNVFSLSSSDGHFLVEETDVCSNASRCSHSNILANDSGLYAVPLATSIHNEPHVTDGTPCTVGGGVCLAPMTWASPLFV
jgi:hypothetical protein